MTKDEIKELFEKIKSKRTQKKNANDKSMPAVKTASAAVEDKENKTITGSASGYVSMTFVDEYGNEMYSSEGPLGYLWGTFFSVCCELEYVSLLADKNIPVEKVISCRLYVSETSSYTDNYYIFTSDGTELRECSPVDGCLVVPLKEIYDVCGTTSFVIVPAQNCTSCDLLNENDASYEIRYVIPPKILQSLSITTKPAKTVYIEGEKFDPQGMLVTAHYNDGTSEPVTEYTYSPIGPLNVTDTLITVSWGGKTTALPIDVECKDLKSISITKPPRELYFVEGESFSPVGMEVTANYGNAPSEVVETYEISPSGALGTADKRVTVSYTHGGVTETDVQYVTVLKKEEGYYGTKYLGRCEYGENPKFNLAMQRLQFIQPLLHIGANNYEVGVSLVYDSQMRYKLANVCNGLPSGWKLDAQQFLIEEGKDDKGASAYKYIDGAGYVHTFYPYENDSTRYYDIDGLGLELNAAAGTIADAAGNRLIFVDGRLSEKVSCYGGKKKKIYKYENGFLKKIYDERTLVSAVPDTYLHFEYNEKDLLSVVSGYDRGILKQKMRFLYDENEQIGSIVVYSADRKENKTVSKYSYDENGKLAYIEDVEKSTATKIAHHFNAINGDYTVSKISSGIVNAGGEYREKTFFSLAFAYVRTSDFKTYREIRLVNEKGLRTSVHFDGSGQITGTFECTQGKEKLKTYTKDIGIPLELNGSATNGINGHDAFAFAGSAEWPGISLARTGDDNYRFYKCQFWLNHSSSAQRLQAVLNYRLSDGAQSSSEAELNARSFEGWQLVEIPVDIQNAGNSISYLTLTLQNSKHESVTAKVSDVRFIPVAKTELYFNLKNPVALNRIKGYELTVMKNGVETIENIASGIDSRIFFTRSDLLQTLQLMRKTYPVGNGKSGFDAICNNGAKRIANVENLDLIYREENADRKLALAYTPYCFSEMDPAELVKNFDFRSPTEIDQWGEIYIKIKKLFSHIAPYLSGENQAETADCFVLSSAPDNRSDTRQYITDDGEKIGALSVVSVCTKQEEISGNWHIDINQSAFASFSDRKGNTLLEIDPYGMRKEYTYFDDGTQKTVKLIGADGKKEILLSEAQATTSDAEYIRSTRRGCDAADFTYREPYNQVDTTTINGYDFSVNAYHALGIRYGYEYDAYNERVVGVKAYAGDAVQGKNTVEYKNGRMVRVCDGTCDYRADYDIVSDEITFSAKDGKGDYEEVQKHKTEVNGGTTTKTDTVYRGEETDVQTTRIDVYGRILSVSDGTNVAEYRYKNTGGESACSDTSVRIHDGFAGTTYLYEYDHDYRLKGWSGNGLEAKRLSACEMEYTFGGTEKYLTGTVYDEAVTAAARITGTKNYVGKDSAEKTEFKEEACLSWKYEYDGLGRLTKKRNKNGDMDSDSQYEYVYLESGNRTLPLIKSCSYTGSAFILPGVDFAYYNMNYEYTERGQLSRIEEVFDCGNREWIREAEIIKEYTYDGLNRIKKETVIHNGDSSTREYVYSSDGKIDRIKLSDNVEKKFGYDEKGNLNRSYHYIGGNLKSDLSFWYSYDRYGNRIRKSIPQWPQEGEAGELFSYHWTRGSCLESINYGEQSANYKYDREGRRFEKRVKKLISEVTTKFYYDGKKLLGEDRSDGKKLRYFYDLTGVCGFGYKDGDKEWEYYTYVKNMEGSVVLIKDPMGVILARYEYDLHGTPRLESITSSGYKPDDRESYVGHVNPIRWKGYYYDDDCNPADENNRIEYGHYYIEGRYYDPFEGRYIDAEPIENTFGNAEQINGLDRHSATYDNIHNLLPSNFGIEPTMELYKDPNEAAGKTYTIDADVPWWKWLIDGLQMIAGTIMLFTPAAAMGVGLLFSGTLGIISNVLSSQLAGGIAMTMTGLQAFVTSMQLLLGTCNPAIMLCAVAGAVAGIAAMAFGTAEIQEGVGYENWIKDAGILGNCDYDTTMAVANGISVFVNIVGPIAQKYGAKCFIAGTLVVCLDENGEECHKPIEEIEVGDMVLAYDEETGKQAYKSVVRLFRNESKEWTIVRVNGKEIESTPGHKYYLPLTKEWKSARLLKKGDKVLLSDGKSVIIESVKSKHYDEPQTTYNFEVEDYHTYYVGTGVCVHNRNCGPISPEKVKESYIKNNNIDAHALKREVLGNKSKDIAKFDIFKDKASNNRIWLGNKSQTVWYDTTYYLEDLIIYFGGN